MTKVRLLIILFVVLGFGVYLWFDLGRFLGLSYLQSRLSELQSLAAAHVLLSSLIYSAAYIVLAAISFPGAAVLTISAGALFGFLWGSVLASFASTIGAAVAFLASRFLLRDFVERRFPVQLARANEGLRTDGAYYLFALRLVPIFPYFVINLILGPTRLPLSTFYWVSQVGMLPSTFLYVNAGTQLATIQSARDVLSPGVAASLALLGFFPLVARKTTDAVIRWHRRRQ